MHPKLVTAAILSTLSIVGSVAFGWIGFGMLSEPGAPLAIRGFGAIGLAYAVLQGVLLFRAWERQPGEHDRMAAIGAGVFFVAMLASAAADGNIEDMEQSALVLAAALLFVNWLSVARVSRFYRATAR